MPTPVNSLACIGPIDKRFAVREDLERLALHGRVGQNQTEVALLEWLLTVAII